MEAIELAEDFVARSGSPRGFYDEVAIPALRLAEHDRTRDGSDAAGGRLGAEGMDTVVSEMADLWPDEPSRPLRKQSVLCIGGRTELDGAAASIITQTISRDGITASVLPPVSLRPQGVGQIALEGIDTVCITYLGDNSATYLRFAVSMLPELDTLTVVRSVEAAEAAILALSAIEDAAGAEEELSTAEKLRHRVRPGASVNEFTSRVANAFGAPISVLSIAEAGEGDGAVEPRQNELTTPRDHVVRKGAPVAVDIAAAEPELVENTFLVENGFGFFAGAPVRLEEHNYGALLVFSKSGPQFTDEQLVELQAFADEFVVSRQAELPVEAA